MLRVVLDANVYISALIQPKGPPGQIIDRFLREQPFEIVMSAAIADETLKAFTYPKVRKRISAAADAALWFENLILLAELVAGDYEVSGVTRDSDDDKYLAAAVEGGASLVVSGDPDLLTIREYAGVRIVTPRAFLDLITDGRVDRASFSSVNESSATGRRSRQKAVPSRGDRSRNARR